jgi:hypothetical protein
MGAHEKIGTRPGTPPMAGGPWNPGNGLVVRRRRPQRLMGLSSSLQRTQPLMGVKTSPSLRVRGGALAFS